MEIINYIIEKIKIKKFVGFTQVLMNLVGRVVMATADDATMMETPVLQRLLLRSFATFLLLSTGCEHANELSGVDEAFVVDIHLVVRLVDLIGGELVTPGHKRVSEPLGVDLALVVEGLEGVDDDVILVGATRHAVGEEGEELGEVDGARRLADHLIEFLLGGEPAEGVKRGAKVVLADDAILVVVH